MGDVYQPFPSGAPGMNGELKICPGTGYVVAVLANLDPSAATRVADFITNRLPIKKDVIARKL